MKERVRFAPSPTGPLHIGGLRTALFNYLYAKSTEGVFILRIEDTDKNRYVKKSEEYIQNALSWAGISPDESTYTGGKYGPYKQSERLSLYKENINELIKKNKAYYAFDSNIKLDELRKNQESKGKKFNYGFNNRLELDNSLSLTKQQTEERIKTETYVIRLRIDPGETIVSDLLRGTLKIKNEILDDKILIKADGFPTYHFANVVDDHLMKITTVIRGEEWLPSLAIHELLYKAFNWKKPRFLHLPLILKPTGKGKLSKRDGEKQGFPVFPLKWENTLGYKELGYTSIGLINYISLLGWNPGTDREIFSLNELIDNFSIGGIQKGGARFDIDKAKWINHKHLSSSQFEDFAKIFPDKCSVLKKHFDKNSKIIFDELKKRMVLGSDFDSELLPFVEAPKSYDDKFITSLSKKHDLLKVLFEIEKVLKKDGVDDLKEKLYELGKSQGIKFSLIMQLLRLSLVGKMSGPNVFFITKIIKDSLSLERVRYLINHIKNPQTL